MRHLNCGYSECRQFYKYFWAPSKYIDCDLVYFPHSSKFELSNPHFAQFYLVFLWILLNLRRKILKETSIVIIDVSDVYKSRFCFAKSLDNTNYQSTELSYWNRTLWIILSESFCMFKFVFVTARRRLRVNKVVVVLLNYIWRRH